MTGLGPDGREGGQQEVQEAIVVIIGPGYGGIIRRGVRQARRSSIVESPSSIVVKKLDHDSVVALACEQQVEPPVVVVIAPGDTPDLKLGKTRWRCVVKGSSSIIVVQPDHRPAA